MRQADGAGSAVFTISEPPVVTVTDGSGTPVHSELLDKLFNQLGPEMDAAGLFDQPATQIRIDITGNNANPREKLKAALKALDEAAARDPNNQTIRRMRETLQKAIEDQAPPGQ